MDKLVIIAAHIVNGDDVRAARLGTRFGRMDLMSQLALLAVEPLAPQFESVARERIAICNTCGRGGRASGREKEGDAKAKDASPPAGSGSDKDLAKGKRPTLRDVVAQGNVVITQKTRRATGQVAVFSQTMRQLVLGGDPVLRDGPNEVTGDRIVVYLDEGRSVVESGGKKRVSAVLYPGSERGLGETAGKPAEKPSATGKKR